MGVDRFLSELLLAGIITHLGEFEKALGRHGLVIVPEPRVDTVGYKGRRVTCMPTDIRVKECPSCTDLCSEFHDCGKCWNCAIAGKNVDSH